VAGVILSAPLLRMAKGSKLGRVKKIVIEALSDHMQNVVLNPMVPVNSICSD
jgi:hypothetical protein